MIRATDYSADVCEPFWANATLTVPRRATGLIVVAHPRTSGMSKRSRRETAEYLSRYQLACCSVEITQEDEQFAGRILVDNETLADRLEGVVHYLRELDETSSLPLAVFGEQHCGAAALVVAARQGASIIAAGAYCGRPDLVRDHLPRVRTPTLLVVPGREPALVAQNERAFDLLSCPSQLAVIRNATGGLRENGAAQSCRYLIRRWCEQHLMSRAERRRAS